MRDLEKYRGIIPAFYACYEDDGSVSAERTQALTQHLIDKNVKGVYVCGSSGECIYQSKEERKLILENVMKIAKGKITVIAHVACNNTADSQELAAHAESLGVDAIASIPPIYFHLPDHAIAQYWNDISSAAPNTDFIIYNIPQLAGVALSIPLYKEMLKNPNVIGVKNSSMPVQDIQMFKDVKGDDSVVFNGPDEQFISGRLIGADGGIGGTYAVMPELFLAADAALKIFNPCKNTVYRAYFYLVYGVFSDSLCGLTLFTLILAVIPRLAGFSVLHIILSGCFSHGLISDHYCPYISAGFRNHQHSNCRYGICPQNDRNIKSKAQHNGKPHPAEISVLVLFRTSVKQNDHDQSQNGKRNVSVDSPGQRRISSCPGILRKQAENNTKSCHQIYSYCNFFFSFDLIAVSPYIIEKNIKHCHCNRGNKFTDAKSRCIIFQPCCT